MNTTKLIPAVVVLTLAACTGEEGQRVELGADTAESTQLRRADWPEGLAADVDSANAAYAAGEYAMAAGIYRSLTEQHPEIGTVWFGLYMAENALGNTDAAAAALERAEAANPGLGQMHEAAESATMPGMPAGHPPLDSVNPEDAPPLEMDDGGVEPQG